MRQLIAVADLDTQVGVIALGKAAAREAAAREAAARQQQLGSSRGIACPGAGLRGGGRVVAPGA